MRTVLTFGLLVLPAFAHADDAELRKAIALYASFDEWPEADFGKGALKFSTRTNDPDKKGEFKHEKGFDAQVFTLNRKKGVHNACLEVVDVLPDNGRIYFPAKNNIGFKPGGWGGAVSMWVNFDPNLMLKTKFCDPVQITQKGANNGGIWFDFNDAKPRDLRHGAFTAVPDGTKTLTEDMADAPMVKLPRVAFKQGEWRHVVLSWNNFDTGKPDAVSQLWIDGRLIGEVKDRPIAMNWDMDKAGIYVAINFIGLLDEFAVFNRPLTPGEVETLYKSPGVLAAVKK